LMSPVHDAIESHHMGETEELSEEDFFYNLRDLFVDIHKAGALESVDGVGEFHFPQIQNRLNNLIIR
jgi:hypothetical protein